MKIATNAGNWIAGAALALSLGACGPMATPPRGQVADFHADAGYRYDAVVQAASAGAIPVEVRGAAAGLSEAALAEAVIDAMPSRSIGLANRFQRGPGASPERVVWVLGASDGGGRLEAICGAAPSPAPAPTSGRLAVAAAWCRGPLALTAVRASADDIANPADPAFGELIATLTGKLFPMVPPGERVRGALTTPANVVIAVE